MNEWSFGGEIFYLKEVDGEFKYSVKIRGVGQRLNAVSTQPVEMSCLVPADIAKNSKKTLKLYSNTTMAGHLESFTKFDNKGNVVSKTMFIVDYILDEQVR